MVGADTYAERFHEASEPTASQAREMPPASNPRVSQADKRGPCRIRFNKPTTLKEQRCAVGSGSILLGVGRAYTRDNMSRDRGAAVGGKGFRSREVFTRGRDPARTVKRTRQESRMRRHVHSPASYHASMSGRSPAYTSYTMHQVSRAGAPGTWTGFSASLSGHPGEYGSYAAA